MGLFQSDADKKAKEDEKVAKMLNKYGLNNISSEYIDAVKNINYQLAGSKLSEFGNLLAPTANEGARISAQYLGAIVQQNWIIIKELDDISKKLSK